MVPGEPRPAPRRTTSITTVQRWVLSALVLVTANLLAGGLIVIAVTTSASQPGTRIGLLIDAAAISTAAVVGCLLIHRRRPVSWWLLAGPVPALIGAFLCFAG
jgi:hypothetical protein